MQHSQDARVSFIHYLDGLEICEVGDGVRELKDHEHRSL